MVEMIIVLKAVSDYNNDTATTIPNITTITRVVISLMAFIDNGIQEGGQKNEYHK